MQNYINNLEEAVQQGNCEAIRRIINEVKVRVSEVIIISLDLFNDCRWK